MKFGVHSYMTVDNVDSRPIDEMAATAVAWGAQGVEVHMYRPLMDNLVSPDPAVRKAGVQHITSIAERSHTWRRLCTEKDLVTEGIEDLRGLR